MNELPISSKYRSTPKAPVTEDERNQLTWRLNDAYTRGDLGQADYRQRLDLLYAAQQLGDLVPVVEGLAAKQTYADPGLDTRGSGQPGELSKARPAGMLTLAVVGGTAAILILLIVVVVVALAG